MKTVTTDIEPEQCPNCDYYKFHAALQYSVESKRVKTAWYRFDEIERKVIPERAGRLCDECGYREWSE